MKANFNIEIEVPVLNYPDQESKKVEFLCCYYVGTSLRCCGRYFEFSKALEKAANYSIAHDNINVFVMRSCLTLQIV